MRLYIEPEAAGELEEAAQRYERAVLGLGFEFLAEMRQRTEAILEAWPKGWAGQWADSSTWPSRTSWHTMTGMADAARVLGKALALTADERARIAQE